MYNLLDITFCTLQTIKTELWAHLSLYRGSPGYSCSLYLIMSSFYNEHYFIYFHI